MLKPPQTWRLYHRLQIFAENHEHFYMMEIMMGCSQAESIIISARWLGRYFSDRRIITDLNPYTWRLQKIIMVNGLFALKTIIFDAELNCFSVEGKLQHSRVKKKFPNSIWKPLTIFSLIFDIQILKVYWENIQWIIIKERKEILFRVQLQEQWLYNKFAQK